MPKVKDKERILKTAREKETVTYKGVHCHQTIITWNVKETYLRKKIKTMNNKMAINTYLSTIESKKQTKQTRTETESRIRRAFW